MSKVAIVTGGSSGIGLCTARSLRDWGCIVYEISRREKNEEPGIHHASADVSIPESAVGAVDWIFREAGRIDILINNAGMGISGAVEFTEIQDAHRQMDVNFFGMVNMTKAVLPYMRAAGGGRIVNTSSVAGVVPIPFQTFYSASKAAINSYTMALANEVRDFGISVCAVMPGDIRTGFTDARKKSCMGNAEYGGRIERSVSRMEQDERGGMDPQQVGDFFAKTALRQKVKPLYIAGWSYRFAGLAVKLLPAALANQLIGRLYAK